MMHGQTNIKFYVEIVLTYTFLIASTKGVPIRKSFLM